MDRFGQLLAAVLLSSFCLLVSTASAELYRYVDDSGEIHVVDDFGAVPEQYREASLREAERRAGNGAFNIIDTPRPATPAAGGRLSPAPQAAPGGGHDESWWRSQSQKILNRIAEAKNALQTAREDDENTSHIYGSPNASPNRARPRGGRNLGRAAALSAAGDSDESSIEEIEQAVAKAERDYEQLHDDARRAGVPPGWLR